MGCAGSKPAPKKEEKKSEPPKVISGGVGETPLQIAEDELEAVEQCFFCGNDTSGCCTLPDLCCCMANCIPSCDCTCACPTCEMCACCAKPPPPPETAKKTTTKKVVPKRTAGK